MRAFKIHKQLKNDQAHGSSCAWSFFLVYPIVSFRFRTALFASFPFQWSPIAFAQIHQPLCFRNLRFHLHDQHLQLLLALLSGMGVDIAGVFFTVGPFGRIAAFKEVIVDLGDAAGAGLMPCYWDYADLPSDPAVLWYVFFLIPFP